eukprot:SAG11_NODE_14_length_26344_cov_14.209411_3_plen_967_part_00
MKRIFTQIDFNRLFGGNIDAVLVDLTQYDNAELVTAATCVMMNEYCQRKSLTRALTEVQLLCSKADIGFFSDANSMLSALVEFMKSDQGRTEEESCKFKLLQATETLMTIKTPEELAAKQQLFKNVKFPDQVIDILKLGLREKDKWRPEDLPSAKSGNSNGIGIARRDLTRVPMFRAAYGFLRMCCKGNNVIKENLASRENFAMFIQHLDMKGNSIPAEDGGDEKAAPPPIIELGAGGLVQELFHENQKLVQAVRADQVKKFVNLIVNNRCLPEWLKYLDAIVVVKNKNDDKVNPIKRNQQLVIKALIQNKSKTMAPALYKNPEEWQQCVELMETKDRGKTPIELEYHIRLVDLLFKCAQGKNKAAEQLCQAEVPLESVHRGLVDPKTIPQVKKVYLNFLWESYIELERPKKATPTHENIWQCLARLADDLANSQINMIPGHKDPDWMVDEIQYLYRAAVPFLTKWFTPSTEADPRPYSYNPDSWTHVDREEQENIKHIAQRLFDGVCTLLEKPADPSCQISILDTEAGYTCAMTMYNVRWLNGAEEVHKAHPDEQWRTQVINGRRHQVLRPSSEGKRELAHSFWKKGIELLEKTDQFKVKAGMPPKPALIQMALGLFAKDFDAAIDEAEEMLGIAGYFRNILAGKEKRLLYGDDTNDQFAPDTYVSALVKQVRVCALGPFKGNSRLVADYKHKLSLTLRLMVDEVTFPFTKGASAKERHKNAAYRIEMQNRFCGWIGSNFGGVIDMPNMIVSVLAQRNPVLEDEVAADVLTLFYFLVRKGNQIVQRKFIEHLKGARAQRVDFKRTELFFDCLESRITRGLLEAKTSRNFYAGKKEQEAEKQQQLEEQARQMKGEKPDKTLLAIDKAREPPEETFSETSCVEQILMVMQQLCEENFQEMKELLAHQPGTDINHNLFRNALSFMDVWQKNMGPHNIHLGESPTTQSAVERFPVLKFGYAQETRFSQR